MVDNCTDYQNGAITQNLSCSNVCDFILLEIVFEH